MPPTPSPGRASAILIALLAGVPTLVAVGTPAGRSLVFEGGDFLNLVTVGFPAGLGLTVVTLVLATTRFVPTVATLMHDLKAVLGAALAFESARLVSTLWLLWGRGLLLDAGLVATLAVAGSAMLAGVWAMAQAARGPTQLRGMADRAALVGGLALVAVPLFPWMVLVGSGDVGGSAPLLFNDLTDPDFSAIELDAEAATSLWTITGAVAGTLVAALATSPAAPWGRLTGIGRLARLLLVGAGAALVLVGYVLYVVRTLALDDAFTAGSVLPLFNYAPIALVVTALVVVVREPVRRARVRRSPGHVFTPTR